MTTFSQNPAHIVTALKHAVEMHRSGRLADAADLYRLVLRTDPHQFDALYFLGLIEAQRENFTEADRLMSRALRINPRSADAFSNHASALNALDRAQEAVEACDQALKLNPRMAEALINRGDALQGLGDYAQAVESYDRALVMHPRHFIALTNRGNALHALNRSHAACVSYDKALQINPGYVPAWMYRGTVLWHLDQHNDALESYDKALALAPHYIPALINRGNALGGLNRHSEALASYDKALVAKPGDPVALTSRGNALATLDRFDEAVAAYDEALAAVPNHVEALYHRGNCLRAMGRQQEALASYDKAITHAPGNAAIRFAACMAQLPIIYMEQDEIGRTRRAYAARLDALCAELDHRPSLQDWASAAGSNQPFQLASQGMNDHDLQRRYGTLICRIMAARYAPLAPPPPPPEDELLRVGIVSGFFREHANWKIPIKGWLGQLNRSRFQIFGYHTGNVTDGETKAAAALCSRFVQGPLTLDRWREAIMADAPHVLIYPEIGVDSICAQLAAQRLAKVQCNSWGHPDTSGFPTLDYFLSSDLMEPANGDDHYTEKLVRLPNLSFYYEPPASEPASLARDQFGLRADATVYWCGHPLYKYLPQFDSVFPRIAREAGNCQFVFISYDRGAYVTEMFRQRLDRAFAAEDLRADDHCVVLERLNGQRFTAAMGSCDVVLDSIGWSDCNSTIEALPHALPIVAADGPLMRGRHSTAILTMMNVTETIAGTLDEYVAIAVRLARDPSWRAAIKQRMADNRHKIYRDRACISALEDFLERVARAA